MSTTANPPPSERPLLAYTGPATQPSRDICLQGRLVSIVPASTQHDVDLYSALQMPQDASLFDYLFDEPWQTLIEVREALAKREISTNPWFYAIKSEESAVGLFALMRMDQHNRVIEVGNILFTRRLQRTTAATEALYLLACYVFETLGYRRLEWKCDAGNMPSRRAALRYGFQFEGVFRQHMILKNGRNRDTAWYAILDGEWPVAKRGMEAWLNPSNFTPEGKQVETLEALRARLP